MPVYFTVFGTAVAVNVVMADVPWRFRIALMGLVKPPVPARAAETVNPFALVLLFVTVMPVAVRLANVN